MENTSQARTGRTAGLGREKVERARRISHIAIVGALSEPEQRRDNYSERHRVDTMMILVT